MTTKKFVVEVTIKKYHPKDDLKYIMSRLEDAVKNSSFQWRDSLMIKEIKNDK
tara:strand:- start:568 stop:726 length:159 start_codon:yes stop_codon:yes gene_type:complete